MAKNVLSSSSYWQLNKYFTLEYGIINSLFLSDISSRYDYFESKGKLDEDGFFFCERLDIEKDTSLSIHKQISATKALQKIGVLEVKKKGIPPKNYYKINTKKVNDLINDLMNSK